MDEYKVLGGSSDAVLKGRSERVRGRGMATGSIITGGSSMSLALALVLGVSLSVGVGRYEEGALSRSCFSLGGRNLLDFRGLEDGNVDPGMGVSGGDADEELPLARLVVLVLPKVGSVMDLERSRVDCFCKNLGSLEPWVKTGDDGDGVCRECLLFDIGDYRMVF